MASKEEESRVVVSKKKLNHYKSICFPSLTFDLLLITYLHYLQLLLAFLVNHISSMDLSIELQNRLKFAIALIQLTAIEHVIISLY